MANPNTKIIIQEVDETFARGAGVSSDVAYIPGLAVDSYITGQDENEVTHLTIKNKPVLCYSVADFEAAFGPTPYVMTAADVDSGNYLNNYEVGGFDRSYIYAKELLQAGLPIYYENIAPQGEVIQNIAEISEVYDLNGETEQLINDSSNIEEIAVNSYKYIACKDRKNVTEKYSFTFTLPTPPTVKKAKTLTENTLTSGAVCVSAIVKETTDIVISTKSLTCNATGKFEIERSNNGDYVITWSERTVADFASTVFTLEIEFTYSGNEYEVEYPFNLAIVQGSSINGEVVNGRINYLYEHLTDALLRLEDKNEYTVKYITSGGYPTYDIGYGTLYATMLSVAGKRGDAVALIDHLDRPEAPHGVNASGSIFNKVNTNMANIDNAEYGAMFTPWGKYAFSTITDDEVHPAFMPASFGYLMCMASAIATSPNWLAMAGVTRGAVPNLQSLHTDTILSNVVAEDYQPKYGTGKNVSINCITNIKPYGLCIWGNRTLQPMNPKGAVALNFLNTRNMVSDIKKVAYDTAKQLMFEQDSDVLWLRFKSMVSPLLDQLQSGYGISGYKLIRGKTKYNGQALTRGEMAAVIKIFPIAPIEYFEITVVLADDDVQVS